MMTFVNMDAPGLVILPTHRVVFGLENFSIFEMVAKLQANFEVEDLGPLTEIDGACNACARPARDRTALLAVTAHSAFLLRATAGNTVEWRGRSLGAAARARRGATAQAGAGRERWACRKKTFAPRST